MDNYYILDIKYRIYLSLIILFLIILLYSFGFKYYFLLFKYYINDCKNLKKHNNLFNHPLNLDKIFLSICIPVYNMEQYIERALLSIINQTFQNFEIILVNDNSNDNSKQLIQKYQINDPRIRIINHFENKGVYSSRKEAILNSKGEYILLIDPDDMILNPELFQSSFDYNKEKNLDLIEFSVFHQIEGNDKLKIPNIAELNHFHNYENQIIYQPELSNLIYYIPNTKNYTYILCRTIWNKIIRKEIVAKSFHYLDSLFLNKFLIAADDTPVNMLSFEFANNFSNINLPGYLYNVRRNSMSRVKVGYERDIILSYNYLLFYKLFYKYINDFKKDINFFWYDFHNNYRFLSSIRKFNHTLYKKEAIEFFEFLSADKNIPDNFVEFINKLIQKYNYS